MTLPEDLKRYIDLPTNNELLVDIYRATVLGLEYSNYEATQLDSICTKVVDYIEKDGSVKQ